MIIGKKIIKYFVGGDVIVSFKHAQKRFIANS